MCPRLRHLPEDDLDVARAAAEDGQRLAVALRRALRLRAVVVEAQVEDLAPGRRVRTDAFACRLMNTSALLLLATAARSSRPTVWSPSRVRITRTPSRPSIAAFSRRATLSVTSFSRAPRPAAPPPCAASPCVEAHATETRPRRGLQQPRGRRRGRGWRRGRGGGRRGRFGRLRNQVDDDPSRAPLARSIGGAKGSEPWSEIERDDDRRVGHAQGLKDIRDRGGRQRRVEHVGVEPNQQAVGFLRHRVRGRGRHLERDPRQRILRLDARGDPRHPNVAGHDQS